MEKINLNAIAKEYHDKKRERDIERAVALVEQKVLPMLRAAAECGKFSATVDLRCESVRPSDVQNAIAERVVCTFSGTGTRFGVFWTA